MDVLEYFSLKEQPFRIGPDPRFLYLSDQVQETLAKCVYMAKECIGPLYISGPVGGGKTSSLRRLYDALSADERYRVAMLISPNVKTSNAFLRIILDTFDVPTWRSVTSRERSVCPPRCAGRCTSNRSVSATPQQTNCSRSSSRW